MFCKVVLQSKANYTAQLKHLRQTYITKEDTFINRGISMQHSNYRTTAKHYINKREIAKQMVKRARQFILICGDSKQRVTSNSIKEK